ncbi:hypothetical protein P3W53_28540 [Pseudomonas denitrificans (nom. rej.)]|nr:hypothetical protein [Pseudomonas denitrificans (nom. rej.)]
MKNGTLVARVMALAAMLLLWSGLARADGTDEEEWARHQARMAVKAKAIPSMVERYAELVGCAVAFDPKNVVPYTVRGRSGFIAVLGLNEDCGGGVTMNIPYVVAVRWGGYETLLIDPVMSKAANNLPRVIDRVWLDGAIVRYAGREASASDAACCASKPVSGTITYQNEQWIDPTLP